VALGVRQPQDGGYGAVNQEYEAYVYRYDKLRDTALLASSDPPKAPFPL